MDEILSNATIDAICRTCFKDSNRYAFIYKQVSQKSAYSVADFIEMFSATKVSKDDELPQYICKNCYGILMKAYEFKVRSEATYNYLRDNYIHLYHDSLTVTAPLDVLENDQKEFQIELLGKPKKENEEYPCSLCPKVFTRNCFLKRHAKTHSHDKKYFCQTCNKYYKNEIHHKWIHKKGRRYTCETCGNLFFSPRGLQDHKATHSSVRDLIFCNEPDCGKTFKTANGLDYHKSAAHSEGKKWLCQICSKSFKGKVNLTLHMTYHNTEKSYQCRYCSNKYKNSRLRNQHEHRMHKMKEPSYKKFSCAECVKEFTMKSHLKRHMLNVHLDE